MLAYIDDLNDRDFHSKTEKTKMFFPATPFIRYFYEDSYFDDEFGIFNIDGFNLDTVIDNFILQEKTEEITYALLDFNIEKEDFRTHVVKNKEGPYETVFMYRNMELQEQPEGSPYKFLAVGNPEVRHFSHVTVMSGKTEKDGFRMLVVQNDDYINSSVFAEPLGFKTNRETILE